MTFVLSLGITNTVLADQVYVRDTLYVQLRGGQSSEHRILHQGIRSGTVLERLEVNEDTGFSRVCTAGGLEGWVQSQYIVTEPIAEDVLDGIKEKLANVEAEYELVREQIRDQQISSQSYLDQIEALKLENTSLKHELATITDLTSNVIAIDQMNEQLQNERELLNQQIDDLAKGISELRDTSNQDWFLRGAGTIMLGLLFGFWVARRVYRRQTSNWT
jgi:SH3 domain protein